MIEQTSALGGRPRVLLVGSSGGHLAQLLTLRDWWMDTQRHWVTFRTPDAVSQLETESVTWAHFPTTRNAHNALRNLLLAAKDVWRLRPDLIVSTGAAVALPYFLVGKLAGAQTAYIEVYDRIDSTTLTGRLVRPVTDLFCVQWREQQVLYPGSVLIGHLL